MVRYPNTNNVKVITSGEFWAIAFESDNKEPEKFTQYQRGFGFGFDHLTFKVADSIYNLIAYHYYDNNDWLERSEYVAWISYDTPEFVISWDQFWAVFHSSEKYRTSFTTDKHVYCIVQKNSWEYVFRINSQHKEPNMITCHHMG